MSNGSEAIAIVCGLVLWLGVVSWVTFFPVIGVLWSIGWLN